MRTSKELSTISYNTETFLKNKLDELITSKVLYFYAYIRHKPEDDEAGNKVHFHVYMKPYQILQTAELETEFIEYDPKKPKTPRRCIEIRLSKFNDIYLYGLHDKYYLASKNQSRKYEYKHKNWITSDDLSFQVWAKSIDMLEFSPYKAMDKAIKDGLTWREWVRRGCVPINQFEHYKNAWECLHCDTVVRNGRPDHEQQDDELNEYQLAKEQKYINRG